MIKFSAKLTTLLCAFLMSASLAFAALSLDAAKAQGLVGEKPDGMIGAVSGGNPDVAALVTEINAERKARYEAIAARNGTDVSQVQALAGKKLIEGTPSGQFFMNAAGSWQKK